MSEQIPEKTNAEQLDEELVAYLDGELEPQAAQRLESLLASSQQARQRLNQLAVAWDLLDQLPRSSVGDVFTRSTVEMAAVAAEEEIAEASAAGPAKKRFRWMAGGVATLLAAAVGFVAVGLAMPDRNDPLLRNLPVVVNLELYRSVGDVELLKQLRKSNLFADEPADTTSKTTAPATTPPAATATSAPAPLIPPESIADRRAWVAALSPDIKLDLNRNLERFVALSPEEKKSLFAIDDYLRSNPQQAETMMHLLLRYQDWLKGLSPAERADLAEIASPEKRVAEVKRLRQEQESRLFARLGTGQGGSRDTYQLMNWMQTFGAKHEKEILEALPEEKQQQLKRLTQGNDEHGGRKRLYQLQLAWAVLQPNAQVAMPEVTESDLQPLSKQLSADKQTALKSAADTSAQIELLRQWVMAAMRSQRAQFGSQGGWRRGGGGGGSNFGRREEDLKRFEDQLPPDEKKRLNDLSPEQKRSQMWQMMQRQRGASMGPRPGSGQRSLEDRPPEGSPQEESKSSAATPPTERAMDDPPVPPSP